METASSRAGSEGECWHFGPPLGSDFLFQFAPSPLSLLCFSVFNLSLVLYKFVPSLHIILHGLQWQDGPLSGHHNRRKIREQRPSTWAVAFLLRVPFANLGRRSLPGWFGHIFRRLRTVALLACVVGEASTEKS